MDPDDRDFREKWLALQLWRGREMDRRDAIAWKRSVWRLRAEMAAMIVGMVVLIFAAVIAFAALVGETCR